MWSYDDERIELGGFSTWITLVALVVAAGAGVVAWQQRGVALEWRERADRFNAANDDFGTELFEVRSRLQASQDDVAALEERVTTLADQQARARDLAASPETAGIVLAFTDQAVAIAIEAVDTCVAALDGGEPGAARRACTQASQALEGAQAQIGAALRD